MSWWTTQECADPRVSWKAGEQYPQSWWTGDSPPTRRAYISGPMRGYENFNYAAFFAAEEKLLAAGFITVNPARIDQNCPLPHGVDLDPYVARDLEAVKALRPGTDVIVVLDGWAASKGATAEVSVAEWRGVEVWDLATALTVGGRPQDTVTYGALPQADGADETEAYYPGEVASPKVIAMTQEAADRLIEHATKWGSDEVRVTDPQTGGQKGSKPVRFDLIPNDFAYEVDEARPEPSTLGIRSNLFDFWEGRTPTFLIQAATALVTHMGGPLAARLAVATVYGRGAQKYDDNNWRKGYRWSLSYAAALRHLDAIERGEFMDAEMGVPHYANVWWHCATLWTFATEELGTDDRPVRKEAA